MLQSRPNDVSLRSYASKLVFLDFFFPARGVFLELNALTNPVKTFIFIYSIRKRP